LSKLKDYSVGYKTSDIGLKDNYIVELFNLCAKYVVSEVDDFSIGYTLNFVSLLCGCDFLSTWWNTWSSI